MKTLTVGPVLHVGQTLVEQPQVAWPHIIMYTLGLLHSTQTMSGWTLLVSTARQKVHSALHRKHERFFVTLTPWSMHAEQHMCPQLNMHIGFLS